MRYAAQRLKRKASALLDLARSAESRERLRRIRFWNQAHRYVPGLVIDDRSGNRYLVSSGDRAIGRELFVNGAFDPANLDNVVAALAQRGFSPAQVIDVGANIGPTTIDLLTRFPNATGIAFEPEAANFQLLEHNLLANGLRDRVDAYAAAVTDRDGSVTLELSSDNPGDHRVRTTDDRGAFSEERRAVTTVPAWRLDTLLEQGRIRLDRPTLLWIDAQGHEGQVLAGATRFRHLPTVVEFWPYGLKRAAGYEQFLEIARSYSAVIEVQTGPRIIPASDLGALGTEVEARMCDWTDLLLIPSALACLRHGL
jgi:FkbM family methyltransferase